MLSGRTLNLLRFVGAANAAGRREHDLDIASSCESPASKRLSLFTAMKRGFLNSSKAKKVVLAPEAAGNGRA